ncbi:ABC transporter ATP-binding protein/permease [Saccharothrix sp. S26]|uniref:ABC transporter ATP-binding protein n=1 Tax=Saccharothrix sp. S26 TaxID=2907215 RepID=UPI001F221501|nr:ABC transporter ATP-binding protein [Saccharothrix sp. S26]MCE6995239.1 ABC transporter ATP-binding protein/permease [Saccharothrix sp. S26]
MSGILGGCADLLHVAWREDPRRLLVAAVLMIGQAVALPLASAVLAVFTDASVAGDVGRAVGAAAATAGLVVASLVLGNFAHLAYEELGELTLLRFDRALVDVANGSARLDHHERPEYADRLHVLRQELQRVGWNGVQALVPSLGLVAGIGMTAVLLGSLDPWLLLLPLASVPPVVAGRRAEAVVAAARERVSEVRRRAWHLFAMVADRGPAMELRVCELGDEVRRRHAQLWRTASDELVRAETRAALLRLAGQGVFAAVYAAVTLTVVLDAVSGRHSAGDVVLAVTLAGQVAGQVTSASALLRDLQRSAAAMASLRWARGVTATGTPSDAVLPPDRIREGIRLRGVTFGYPGAKRPVADRLDVFLPAGATVALVGENGAGKTSLVKLLCRFHEPDAGTIEVDGVDLRRFDPAAWQRRIAAGFQDFVRFELSVRHVVGVGELPLADSDPAVRAALRRAGSEDVLDRFDGDLDTLLGSSFPDGTELSGGQWQKLAVGRAMMREDPLLLVLDEPTSALDPQTEHLLFERYAATARRTSNNGSITLVVSHRFSTVRDADLILVLAEGRLVQAGDHDALMAEGGIYRDLYELQAGSYRSSSEAAGG